jgi:hypothetical protein
MFRQSARSGLRPDQKPPDLSPAMGNYSCRQRGSLPVFTRLDAEFCPAALAGAARAENFRRCRRTMFSPH